MYSRVKKVFIGTDQSRTGTIMWQFHNGGGATTQDALPGEVIVLDKNKDVMAPGKTYTDSNVIYIAEVLSSTSTYANAAGTSATAYNVLLSDPIDGAYVRSFSGKSYSARTQASVAFAYLTDTIVVGDEWNLRIVYKDVKEHPGQKTHSYRVITTSNSLQTLYDAFVSVINADSKARVTAARGSSSTTSTLTLTAKAIPECTTGLDDIDAFSMVSFEAFIYWIDQTSSTYKGIGPFNKPTYNSAVTVTGPTYPNGSWEIVRDAEKDSLGQQFGVTNMIWFPVRKPTQRAVLSETYDTIVIEHDAAYQSPDNQYVKTNKHETQIFIPNPTTTNQSTDILAVLNPWMASTPGAFGAVTV